MTIEELRNSGLIYHMYHLNTKTRDEDTGGVVFCPREKLLGLREFYPEQVADEKNDTVFYEFGRWVELLIKSNPSALESLFAPDDCVIGNVHPIIQEFRNHRDLFLTKECKSERLVAITRNATFPRIFSVKTSLTSALPSRIRALSQLRTS